MRKILFLVLLAAVAFSGCIQPVEPPINDAELEASWALIKAEQDKQLWASSEWQQPQNIGPPVNSLGWEDGAFISGDGKKLFISYFGGDVFNYLRQGFSKQYLRGPKRGFSRESIDSIVSEKVNGEWQVPVLDDISEAAQTEGGVMVSGNDKYYMSNKDFPTADKIYKNGVMLDFQEPGAYYQDPHYCAAFDELYFWRAETHEIFVFKNGEVSKLPFPINNPENESREFPPNNIQPFLTQDCQEMYFTSDRSGKPEIYKSQRLGEDTWAELEKIVSGLFAVGEPTLTDDKSQLFFVTIYADKVLGFDADVAFAERK